MATLLLSRAGAGQANFNGQKRRRHRSAPGTGATLPRLRDSTARSLSEGALSDTNVKFALFRSTFIPRTNVLSLCRRDITLTHCQHFCCADAFPG